MKKYLYIILLYNISNFAQIDVFSSEVKDENGIIYFQNKPLTGTLYSDDDIEIPNNCQCTLKSIYINGKLNGYKKEWYTNGNKKFEGQYKNGLPIDEHVFYDKNGFTQKKNTFKEGKIITESTYFTNGKIKEKIAYNDSIKDGISKEFDKEGNLLKDIEYNKGRIKRILYYNNHEKQKEEFYSYVHLRIITYKNNKKTKEEVFIKDSTIKDGTWKIFDDNENISTETVYENNKKIKFGSYINNKKAGIWIVYSNDFKYKTIETYKEGTLIKTEKINTEKFIENYPIQENDQVVNYFDEYDNKNLYYIIRFNQSSIYHQEFDQINTILKSKILKRTSLIAKENYSGEKELQGIIQITPLDLKYIEQKMERIRIVNGQQQKYYVPDYFFVSHYNINVQDTNGTTIYNYSLTIDSDQKFGTLLLNKMLKKAKTQEDAFDIALSNVGLGKLASLAFPIQPKISKIKSETSSKIKIVTINKGSKHGVRKKMTFSVFDQENKEYKSKIKIIELNYTFSLGKVINEQSWLKEYMNSHTDVYLREN